MIEEAPMEEASTTRQVDPNILLGALIRKDAAVSLPLQGNANMVRFLSAWWASGRVSWMPPPAVPSDLDPDELWSFTNYDAAALATASGFTLLRVHQMFAQARELKLILPTGDVQPAVARWMNLHAQSNLARMGLNAARLQLQQSAAQVKKLEAEIKEAEKRKFEEEEEAAAFDLMPQA